MGLFSRDKNPQLADAFEPEEVMAANREYRDEAETYMALPARKAGKPTTYSAKGLASGDSQIQQPHLEQEDGSTRPVRILELVPELANQSTRSITYARMMNDASTDVSVRAVKTPVLGADFYVESYSSDPLDMMIANFVWDNLDSGMNQPFCNSLEDILHMYEDGFSVMDKVYEERVWAPGYVTGANSRNYTMLKKLSPRPAGTIKEIKYDDNGGPVSVVQNAIRADNTIQEVELDISKIMIFTFNRQGGDLTGKSILRTAYPHWYYKTHFYKIDAVQKERHSLGVPRGKLLPGFNNNDRGILRRMLRNIRSNEEAYIIETPTVAIDFAKVEANLVNVLESAVHHNAMILLNVMAQFLTLGVEAGSGSSGGGRATAGSQVDMFLKSLRYVANYICQQVNMYLIPELVVWNFPTNNFPKLCVRNIGETRDLQMLASAISNLLAQGGLSMDDPLDEWIRYTFDMPKPDPSTRREPTQPNQPESDPNANGNSNGAKSQKGNVKGDRQGTTGKPPNADR
jgi:hypothetical protein